ncbi:hypothetical protein EV714DRAFT_275024 [Schizophyllum commune]
MRSAAEEGSHDTEHADYIQVTDTDSYMERLFPVPSDIVEEVMTALQSPVAVSGVPVYAEGRWTDFPADDSAATAELYSAFVRLARRVAEEVEKVLSKRPADERRVLCGRWHNYPGVEGSDPESDDSELATGPNCFLALESSADEGIQDDTSWLQVIAVVEAKQHDKQDWAEVVQQLLRFLRQVLVEQQNRRFVFGFALSSKQISVWLQDRSGVLGTEVPINFHEAPEKLVQLLAAFAYLPAHRLGFDPDMRLYRGPNEVPLPPYRMSSSPKKYMCSTQDTHWVVTLDDTDYITAKAVSTMYDELSGSGTLVWVVVKYDDRNKPPPDRELYVLKQQWRLEDEVSEATLYKMVGAGSDCVGQVIDDEEVQVDGQVDSTARAVRRDLHPSTPETGSKRSRLQARLDARRGPQYPLQYVEGGAGVERFVVGWQDGKLSNRIRTRILMSTVGHSIKSFADRRELVRAMIDAIKGDKYLYEHGVLPGDISPGNILIRGLEDNVPVTGGCIIDLDRGKRKTAVALRLPDHTEKIYETPLKDFEHRIAMYTKAGVLLGKVDTEICKRALRATARRTDKPSNDPLRDILRPHMALMYIIEATTYMHKYRRAPLDMQHTIQSLRWDVNLDSRPLFTRSAQGFCDRPDRSRDGTLPFMSPELLGSRPTILVRDSIYTLPEDIYPDAVHDVEAIFWVLAYFCVTRGGPGGQRREELSMDIDDVQDPARRKALELLQITAACCFDSNSQLFHFRYKGKLHAGGLSEFETQILPCFHSYFAPFKDAMIALFKLFQIAYRFRGYEYCSIHDRAIEVLEDLLTKLQAPEYDERENPATVAELKRREKFFDDLRKSIDYFPAERETPESPKVAKSRTSRVRDAQAHEASARADAVEHVTKKRRSNH